MTHIPVLFQETIDALHLTEGMTVVDATFGGGGHSRGIAERIGRQGTVLAIDADADAFRRTDIAAYPSRVIPAVGNFRDLTRMLAEHSIREVDAVLFDLGTSSFSIESSGRGFSFQRDEPLLMTYAETSENGVTAETIVNDWGEETLADIIYGFGEERAARRVAHAIVLARENTRITSTKRLIEIIESVLKRRGRSHPATKTFQAIRMAVNDELGALKEGLHAAFRHVIPGGRIAVISFHSVEDRLIKTLFRTTAKEGQVALITKKPILPKRKEILENPRARSAKLRIVEVISHPAV